MGYAKVSIRILLRDKRISQADSRAKKMAAFFRISFSSQSRLFSAFRTSTSFFDERLLRLPVPGKAAIPCLSISSFHLYKRLRATPSSLANCETSLSPCSSNLTTSCLNSALKSLSYCSCYLHSPLGQLSLLERVRQTGVGLV